MILALDLEHTLIHTVDDPRPRPGLNDFLERVRNRFDRLVIFTALSRADFQAVAKTLVSSGAAPAWFAELEHFRVAPVPDDLWKEAENTPRPLAIFPELAPPSILSALGDTCFIQGSERA